MKTIKEIIIYRLNLLFLAYSFPALMIVFGLSRETNSILYPREGGFGWIFLLFCWPWVLYITIRKLFKLKDEEFKVNLILAVFTIVLYSIVTIPISSRVAQVLNSVHGFQEDGFAFWSGLNFPLSQLFRFLMD